MDTHGVRTNQMLTESIKAIATWIDKSKGHSSFIMQYLILFWFYSFWFWIKIIKETRKLEKSVGQKQGIPNILTQLKKLFLDE